MIRSAMMLWLGASALVGFTIAADPTTLRDGRLANEQYLRRKDLPKPEQGQRRLVTFTIPFSHLWRIEIGNGYPDADRAGTSEEYESVRQVTVDWFDAANAEYYSNATDFSFTDTQCDLIMEDTAWDPSADYPHKIQLQCGANFEADSVEDLPTNIEFILSINQNYDFEDFTRNYLWNAPPPTNIFRYSQRVGYTLTDSGAVIGPSTSAPVAPTEAPVTTTPAPTPPAGTFSGTFVVPLGITWEMAVDPSATDREPTPEEYSGMLNATIAWMTAELNAAYADQSDTFVLSQFLATNENTTWSEGETYPHIIPQDTYAIFNANELSDVPDGMDLMEVMSSDFDVTKFIEDFLRNAEPDDSIFREMTVVRYTSTITTPAGPLNPVSTSPAGAVGAVTEAPVMPPTTTAPVMAPTTATPVIAPTTAAPVMAPTTAAPVIAPTTGAPVMAPTTSAPVPAMSFPTLAPIPVSEGMAVVETETTWRIAIGFGIPDRQPRMDEYMGYVDATDAWMSNTYDTHYNSDDATPNHDKVQNQILSATFDPTLEAAHTIVLRTIHQFALEEGATAPTELEVLRVLTNANLLEYMLNYLHTAEPRFNIFIGTRAVAWTNESVPSTPTAPVPVTTPVAAPVMTPTTNAATAPVASPTTTAPAPDAGSVANGSDANLSELDSVRIFMTLSLALNDRYDGDRMEPTKEEWAGLLMATKKFLTFQLQDYYKDDTTAEFVGLQEVSWMSTTYDEEMESPYVGELQLDVAFMDGSTLMANSGYWEIINGFDFDDYLRNYVWLEFPDDSLFHYADRVAWNFVNA
jgi:hypothetical protein